MGKLITIPEDWNGIEIPDGEVDIMIPAPKSPSIKVTDQTNKQVKLTLTKVGDENRIPGTYIKSTDVKIPSEKLGKRTWGTCVMPMCSTTGIHMFFEFPENESKK